MRCSSGPKQAVDHARGCRFGRSTAPPQQIVGCPGRCDRGRLACQDKASHSGFDENPESQPTLERRHSGTFIRSVCGHWNMELCRSKLFLRNKLLSGFATCNCTLLNCAELTC